MINYNPRDYFPWGCFFHRRVITLSWTFDNIVWVWFMLRPSHPSTPHPRGVCLPIVDATRFPGVFRQIPQRSVLLLSPLYRHVPSSNHVGRWANQICFRDVVTVSLHSLLAFPSDIFDHTRVWNWLFLRTFACVNNCSCMRFCRCQGSVQMLGLLLPE